jgi:hypothetical protein
MRIQDDAFRGVGAQSTGTSHRLVNDIKVHPSCRVTQFQCPSRSGALTVKEPSAGESAALPLHWATALAEPGEAAGRANISWRLLSKCIADVVPLPQAVRRKPSGILCANRDEWNGGSKGSERSCAVNLSASLGYARSPHDRPPASCRRRNLVCIEALHHHPLVALQP